MCISVWSSDVCASDLVQLLRQSPATAYEIAKAASVPRPNTYHALEALAKRGAVLPVSENPIRYVAANPREFLDSISRQTKALCTDLAGKLATVAPTPDDQYVWTLRGDPVVHDTRSEGGRVGKEWVSTFKSRGS